MKKKLTILVCSFNLFNTVQADVGRWLAERGIRLGDWAKSDEIEIVEGYRPGYGTITYRNYYPSASYYSRGVEYVSKEIAQEQLNEEKRKSFLKGFKKGVQSEKEIQQIMSGK